MEYQTYRPHTDLSAFIKCYWTLESPEEEKAQKQTIVPDGCMEMIFHYGDLYRQYTGKATSIIQPRCFVFGQLSQPLEIEPTGATGIFAIRFHPEGFTPFATIPIKTMENRAVPLTELFGEKGNDIAQKILTASTTHKRITLIETFLSEYLANTDVINDIVKSVVDTIITANGQLSIHEISEQQNINRRKLERNFALAIGLSPKQLSKTIRLQATLKLLLNKQFASFTHLAYEAEYYDQAHFIKDFKEFTGLTPKEFYNDNLKLSALFYKD
ncbi:AraC family transcriptional regulator [Pedobacter montanisoli]|uniref:Helix-turn-helix domain-containing protein n=1 Tax=Pedobacter montanisoli TaxID=2923277 RepID=A0ABS9ZXT0_9SPHI|nr:helix-turn-helix domain-containing protein [Pedobacter montanisoli]MCJ0743097.1 helix-turn-helix domain-containing protein [Pedobacter montanisoli]